MSRKKSKKEKSKCVYCSKEKKIAEITKDHVISKNLFPKSYKKNNQITVHSCLECNRGFSKDEEYFRQFVCGLAFGYSQHADALFSSKIKRSIQRKPQIGYKAWKHMKLVNFYSKGGIYLGKRTAVYISNEDWQRYYNVLDKYIKGLFFYKFQVILPSEYKIQHRYLTQKDFSSQQKILNLKWNLDNKEIFAYGYSSVPNTFSSVWMAVFYNTTAFISYVLSQIDLQHLNQR